MQADGVAVEVRCVRVCVVCGYLSQSVDAHWLAIKTSQYNGPMTLVRLMHVVCRGDAVFSIRELTMVLQGGLFTNLSGGRDRVGEMVSTTTPVET
jgi:hypothetical protein